MEKFLIIGFSLAIISTVWMYVQTKKQQTQNRWFWLAFAFFMPLLAVIVFYFTQPKNKALL